MRYLLMTLVLGTVLVATGSDVAARGWRGWRGPAYGGTYRSYNRTRFSSADPYSLHFRSPYPQRYGRWDMYFDMHGAPRGIGF